jgi:hypothetical protein
MNTDGYIADAIATKTDVENPDKLFDNLHNPPKRLGPGQDPEETIYEGEGIVDDDDPIE